jgi:CRISPR-associated protein Csm1
MSAPLTSSRDPRVMRPGSSHPTEIVWPAQGLAIEGDFAGIQHFVLRPVPGARGSARRLRGRSLRVIALSQLIAHKIVDSFSDADANLFYQAGGRFLIVAKACVGWPERLRELQSKLDKWMAAAFSGEVVFHLAAGIFTDGRIPVKALQESMQQRRQRPLVEALLAANCWDESAFFRSAGTEAFRCPTCGKTSDNKCIDEDQREICSECAADTEIGRVLARLQAPALVAEEGGPVLFLGGSYKLCEQHESKPETSMPIQAVHWLPREGKRVLDFDEIARRAIGQRSWLGYLRIDADRIGESFRGLAGDPSGTKDLSQLLQDFFCDTVQELLTRDFPSIYPVYGGGDDLFVIGPWDQTLAFANRLALEFRRKTLGKLTFSAGLALAKPREHILTKSDEAENHLHEAKKTRNCLHALSTELSWGDLPNLLRSAQQLTAWHSAGSLTSSFLRDVLELHHRWKTQQSGGYHQPFLHYQIERNLGVSAQKEWARKHLLAPGDLWPHAGFLVRYAMLSGKKQ